MGQERGRQIPFDELVDMDLVINLDTGEQTLRRRRTGKPAGATRAPAPTRQWWDRMGFLAFTKAAEGWKQGQSAIMAEAFGYNTEFAGSQMNRVETEEILKRSFRTALRSSITSAGVVRMMREESLSLEQKLGTEANWVPAFVDSAINSLAEVYGLNTTNTEALKRIAHQRKLPQFN